jgi:hypothetical protein
VSKEGLWIKSCAQVGIQIDREKINERRKQGFLFSNHVRKKAA